MWALRTERPAKVYFEVLLPLEGALVSLKREILREQRPGIKKYDIKAHNRDLCVCVF